MAELKIEKNIPIPTKRGNKYPFANMEVGDSLLGHGDIRQAALAWARRNDKKVVSRKEGNDGLVRVWRVE